MSKVVKKDEICSIIDKCDIDQISEYLIKKGKASIALTSVDDPRNYGRIALNENQEIIQFSEKGPSKVDGNLINTGVYLMDRELINSFPSILNS